MTTTTGVDRLACVLAWFRQSAEGCQKIPEDLARYQTIIDRLQVAVVVETGTASGHSARFFSRLGCRVVTVDIRDWVDLSMLTMWGGRVTHIVGDSTAPEIVEAVSRAVGDREPVLVSLDSDHSAPHVRAEMEAYAPLVTPGSYMVAEDTVLSWMPLNSPPRSLFDGTPMEAIEDFLTAHNGWQVDTEVEGMFAATQNPGGFLWKMA